MRGEDNRKYFSTEMNPNSSRSHVILQLELDIRSGNRFEKKVITSLTMADLAGSECLEKTKTKGKNTREGSLINKSLLALSNVISKLSRREEFVGFRESKLTRILQPALTGNSLVSVICTVNPQRACIQESVNTLKFGTCAGVVKKKIEMPASDKSGIDDNLVREVMRDLEDMTVKLEEANEGLIEKERELEMCKLKVEEWRTKAQLADNEKSCYFKEVHRLNNEIKLLLSENNKLAATMDDLEVKITNQKELEFRHMFDQQALLIRSLEDDLDKMKQSGDRDEYRMKDVLACMRRPNGSNKGHTTMEPETNTYIERPSDGYLADRSKEIYDKLKSDLEAARMKYMEFHKELLRQQKVNHQLNMDNQALRGEIAQISNLENRSRKSVKTFYSRPTFDRHGDRIETRINMGESTDDLSKRCKHLEQRTKKLERQRDESLEREDNCKIFVIVDLKRLKSIMHKNLFLEERDSVLRDIEIERYRKDLNESVTYRAMSPEGQPKPTSPNKD